MISNCLKKSTYCSKVTLSSSNKVGSISLVSSLWMWGGVKAGEKSHKRRWCLQVTGIVWSRCLWNNDADDVHTRFANVPETSENRSTNYKINYTPTQTSIRLHLTVHTPLLVSEKQWKSECEVQIHFIKQWDKKCLDDLQYYYWQGSEVCIWWTPLSSEHWRGFVDI